MPKLVMHEVEKSDLRVVPMKPANKAARAAAEPAEGSGGTKGNARLQRTVRTQSREAVSLAQSRIREAVDRNKTEKSTALLHHISVELFGGHSSR
jgi:RNA-directed DNA polymerase